LSALDLAAGAGSMVRGSYEQEGLHSNRGVSARHTLYIASGV